MNGKLIKATLVFAATLAVAGPAYGEIAPGTIPTREEYVATVDPICKGNSDTNAPILKNAQRKEKADKLIAASRDVAKVASNFEKTLKAIEAVPRPPEDNARLEKWFGRLKILQTKLRDVSKALKEENTLKATHGSIAVEHSSNAANNVGFFMHFQSCHFKASQFK